MAESAPAPRRGRPPIPLERIVEAALEIVAEEGAGALSLRHLARRLSSSTSTLYRHVENRSALLGLVVDALLAEALPAGRRTDLPWDEECRDIAERLFATLVGHHGAAALLAETVPTGPHALAIREHQLAVLTGAGLPLPDAARAVATLAHTVLGFAMQAAVPAELQPARAGLEGVDEERFPLTREIAAELPIPIEEEFAFGLDLILEGLRRQVEESSSPSAP